MSDKHVTRSPAREAVTATRRATFVNYSVDSFLVQSAYLLTFVVFIQFSAVVLRFSRDFPSALASSA